MTSEQTRVIGDDELARTCHRAADDLGDMSAANAAVGRVILTRAQSAAPRDSGRLVASLHVDSTATEVAVASELVYAPVIHNGWPAHNISPHPFLVPAAHATEPVWREAYEREIERDLNRVKGA